MPEMEILNSLGLRVASNMCLILFLVQLIFALSRGYLLCESCIVDTQINHAFIYIG